MEHGRPDVGLEAGRSVDVEQSLVGLAYSSTCGRAGSGGGSVLITRGGSSVTPAYWLITVSNRVSLGGQ